jgi:hypothetical protein
MDQVGDVPGGFRDLVRLQQLDPRSLFVADFLRDRRG